ncbi:MAG: radical SAM protein [Deltaproteobacteria bacterium]|nr:radical SAM protein [Deltaproteobacteria bacterium]
MKLPGLSLPIARVRAEHFGGVVETLRPRGLLHVDRAMMRTLGVTDSPRWLGLDDGPEAAIDARPLSAPTEVHVVLSRQCAAGCTGCYVDATPQGAALPFADACRILDELSRMGVFHVALGGGEALELDYLFAVAAHARAVGITPNLTTSGLGLDAQTAERCKVFGQINVSVDGIGEDYERARGFDGFKHAERALRLLRAVKPEVGINCVVSRTSFDALDGVAKLTHDLKLNELELLRFKPVGRGASLDEELTLSQAKAIYPLVRKLMLRHRVRIKLDCSFAPMVFFHAPDAEAAAFLGVQGCVGGDVLAAVAPEGHLMGCSFAGPPEADARVPGAMSAAWDKGFRSFRDFVQAPPEPCDTCEYLSLCRGGCRAVANAHGAFQAPDPGCPRVQEFRARAGARTHPLRVVQA